LPRRLLVEARCAVVPTPQRVTSCLTESASRSRSAARRPSHAHSLALATLPLRFNSGAQLGPLKSCWHRPRLARRSTRLPTRPPGGDYWPWCARWGRQMPLAQRSSIRPIRASNVSRSGRHVSGKILVLIQSAASSAPAELVPVVNVKTAKAFLISQVDDLGGDHPPPPCRSAGRSATDRDTGDVSGSAVPPPKAPIRASVPVNQLLVSPSNSADERLAEPMTRRTCSTGRRCERTTGHKIVCRHPGRGRAVLDR